MDLPNVPKKLDEDDFTIDRSKTRKTPRFKNNILKPSARLQMTSLGDESPLIKISNNTSNAANTSNTSTARDHSATTTTAASPEGRKHKSSKKHTNSIIDASALINGRIFETNWHELTGSELIFDDYGELIGQVKEHLTCNDKVKFTPNKKAQQQRSGEQVDFVEFEDDAITGESSSAKSEGNLNLKPSPFLRNAIKLAKRKEYA